MTQSGRIFKPNRPGVSHHKSAETKFTKNKTPAGTDSQQRIKSAVTVVKAGLGILSPGLGKSSTMEYSSDSPSPATPTSMMDEDEPSTASKPADGINEVDDDILELYTELNLNKSLEQYESAFVTGNGNLSDETWIIDSGASIHMTGNLKFFTSFNPKHNGFVQVANGKNIPIKGKGSVKLFIKTANEPFVILVKGVAYVPQLKVNLLSVSELNKSHGSILFEKGICFMKIDNCFTKIGKFIGTSYELTETEAGEQALLCAHEMHLKMAHRNLRDIRRLKNHGLSLTKCNCSDECEACMKRPLWPVQHAVHQRIQIFHDFRRCLHRFHNRILP